MGRTIDITSKLTNEKPVLKIGEVELTVDDSKNTMMKLTKIMDEKEDMMIIMDVAVKMLVGDKGFKAIEEMNLSMSDYKVIFIALMAAASNEEYEVVEERFLKEDNE